MFNSKFLSKMTKSRLDLRRVAAGAACLVEKKVMNRGNFLGKVCFGLLVASAIILSACSSPERDGIKAAKMKYNYQKDYTHKRNEIIKEQNNAYESYIKKFDSYSFKTRVEAREKLSEYLEKSKESFQTLEYNYQEWMNKAAEYRNKLASKYQTNREKESKFYYAYNNYSPKERNSNATQETYVDYSSQIASLIQTIIPPKPDLEQLKNDLIGRKISWDMKQAGTYYWTLLSTEEFKTVDIKETVNTNEIYLLDVHLLLRGEFTNYEANVTVQYILQHHDDWTFNTFQSKDFKIIPTNKYNNCISHGWEGGVFSWPSYYVTNKCDYRLLIIGETKPAAIYALGEIWPLVMFISANSKVKKDGNGIHSIKTIERIGYEAKNFGLR